MRTYHYCAMRESTGGMTYSTGIINTDKDLSEDGAYKEIVQAIADQYTPPANPKSLVILSFTLIQ